MKVYVDDSKENIVVVQSIASASTMISSVAQEAKNYILSQFPDNFFKHVYIDTSETITQQAYNDQYNNTANKIPYPSMTITPEISLDDPIAGTSKSMHMSSPNLFLRKETGRTYKHLIVDPESKFSVYYTCDYITTNFNFKITTNMFIQNTDAAFYLNSKMQKDMFLYLNDRYNQTEVPKTFIKVIASLKGLDLDKESDLDQLRLYLIGTSRTQDSVQLRVNPATGNQCFFINEKNNYLTIFRDLDCPSSINREGQVEGEYVISFTLQVSCWLPNAFMLKVDKNVLKTLKPELFKELDNTKDNLERGFFTSHIFTNEVLTKKETKYFYDNNNTKQIGHLVYSNKYTQKLNETIPTIKYMDKMIPEFHKIHMYCINENLDLSSLIHAFVYSTKGELSQADYTFDYNTMELTLNKSLDTDFAVSIYINRLMYESIKKAIKNNKRYWGKNVMGTIYGKIGQTPVYILVKSFSSDEEMYKVNNNNILRIVTPYGIGYVSLLPDDLKDGYKICLGNDSNGKPIIKKLDVTYAK